MTLTQAPVNLKGRHFLNLADFSAAEDHHLLDLSAELKAQKKAGTEVERLRQKEITPHLREDLHPDPLLVRGRRVRPGRARTYLGPGGSQIGHKESVKDTARVLGRIYDGIEFRGFDQDDRPDLGRIAGVPVYNGLTDEWHPTQTSRTS